MRLRRRSLEPTATSNERSRTPIDLVGYVLEGAADDLVSRAMAEPIAVDDDPVASTHSVMHRLHDLAAARRSADGVRGDGRPNRFVAGVGRWRSQDADPACRDRPGGISVDVQGNRTHHGRPWQAICLYSAERLAELRSEGHPVGAGTTGENLTISGVDWSRMRGGLTIAIGEVALVTSSPAAPCQKIG